MTRPVSVRFDENMYAFLTRVVEEKHTTKTDFIRQAVMDKLEELYDIEMSDKAFKEWLDSGKKTYSHEEAMRKYVQI